MTGMPISSTVYVCPSKDIECGPLQSNWCADCPKHQTRVWAPATPTTALAEKRGAEHVLTEIIKYDLLPYEEREKLVRWLRRQCHLPE